MVTTAGPRPGAASACAPVPEVTARETQQHIFSAACCWRSLWKTSRWSMAPSSAEHADLAEPALALAAVEHHVGAGRRQGLEHGACPAPTVVSMPSRGIRDHELLRVEPAAVAEGLVAQVRPAAARAPSRPGGPRPSAGSARTCTARCRAGPRATPDQLGDLERGALVVDVHLQPVAVQLARAGPGRPSARGCGRRTPAVVGLAASLSTRAMLTMRGDADAAGQQHVARGADPQREVLQRLGGLQRVAGRQRVHEHRSAAGLRRLQHADRQPASPSASDSTTE